MAHNAAPAAPVPAAPATPVPTSVTGLSLDNPHDRNLPPSLLPAVVQWLFIAIFVVAVIASGVLSLLEHWRRATVVLGAAMLWLACVRVSCDSCRVGVLAVRSRRFDTLFAAALGAAMLFLATSIDALGS